LAPSGGEKKREGNIAVGKVRACHLSLLNKKKGEKKRKLAQWRKKGKKERGKVGLARCRPQRAHSNLGREEKCHSDHFKRERITREKRKGKGTCIAVADVDATAYERERKGEH